LSLWHEGIGLQAEHPSLSLVAYSASIEQVGRLVQQSIGRADRPGKTFWSAVALVTDKEELALLRERGIYRLRSEAAHGERLHGLETEYGNALLLHIEPDDPVKQFVFDTVRRVNRVASTLLRDYLNA
jgi:hypothetical protein